MAGMKYSTGTRFNFSVAAGVAEVIRLRVGKAGQLDGLNVSGATFRFYLEDGGGMMSVPVEHGEEAGTLYLSLPRFEAGEYSYSLEFSDAVGEVGVLLHGVLTVMGEVRVAQVVNEANKAEQRVLEVTAGSLHGGPLELRWCASSMAAKCAEDAKAAADRAEEAAGLAEGVREDVSASLELAQAFMESFNKALRESITVVDNYLYVGGVNTGHYVKGEDAPVPEYRSDGYLYLDGKRVAKIKGEDGITPHITADKFWAIGSVKTSTRAEGRDGLDGTAVRRVLIHSVEELPDHEERGVFYYLKIGEKLYDVYVWLDNANGWVNVKETSDIADTEVHGLVKLPAGEQEAGAPVGWKKGDKGAAMVPMAGTAVPGVGKLGSGVVVSFGAPVGMNEDGAYYVGKATAEDYGVVKVSLPGTVSEGGSIGLNSEGQVMVPWATLYAGGVIKLGSQFGQSNPQPYLVGIGATENHELANNYAFGGALQHRKPEGWRGTMPWLDAAMEANPGYFNDMFYSGIMTSAQFRQSQYVGLELLAATENMLAGVYLSTGIDDERAAAVVTAVTLRDTDKAVRDWVELNYYTKELVPTKEELRETLSGYLKKETADGLYAGRAEFQDLNKDAMRRSEFMPCKKVTEEEYNSLGENLDENVAYIIV